MLLSGFDPEQHPLLEVIVSKKSCKTPVFFYPRYKGPQFPEEKCQVILRQKQAALKRAKKQVRIRGCWSARGHPEPQDPNSASGEENLELKDNEVFLMVPCDGEDRLVTCAVKLEGVSIEHNLAASSPSKFPLQGDRVESLERQSDH